MAEDDLKDKRPVLIIVGSILALSFSMNMIGIYVGVSINDWMEFKIEKARTELSCGVKAGERLDQTMQRIKSLQKRFERVEKLAHKKTE